MSLSAKQTKNRQLYEEQLRVSAQNDANIAETRKLAFRGEVPSLTAQEDASAEQLQADEGFQTQQAINNLLTTFKLPETQKIISSLTLDQIAGLNAGWKNIKTGFESQFTTPNLRSVGSFIPYFTKYQNTLTDVNTNQRVNNIKSIIPSIADIDKLVNYVTTNLNRATSGTLIGAVKPYRDVLPRESDYVKIAKYTSKRQQDILQLIPANAQFKSEFDELSQEIMSPSTTNAEKETNLIPQVVTLFERVTDDDITELAKIGIEAQKGKGIKIGKGILVEKEPKYCHFGTFIISKNKLKDCVLQIKYQSGAYVFPQQKVSEALCEWLLSFLDEGKPSKSLYSAIPSDEKLFIERVLHKAGIWNKMTGMGWKPTKDVSADEDERRFEILKGIRGAGNDSPQLRTELKNLLIKFHKQGRISKQKLGEILYDLV
jgi:hypothetical protein